MPRQSRSRPAPKAAPAQTRSSSTVATPAAPSFGQRNAASSAPPPPAGATAQSQAPTSQGPGMLAQMAATAGSVAVGSTIGHGLSNMLFGGSSSAPTEQQQPAAVPQQQQRTMSCDVQAQDFSKCLEKADLNSCSYYLEQLKACQAAAAPY